MSTGQYLHWLEEVEAQRVRELASRQRDAFEPRITVICIGCSWYGRVLDLIATAISRRSPPLESPQDIAIVAAPTSVEASRDRRFPRRSS